MIMMTKQEYEETQLLASYGDCSDITLTTLDIEDLIRGTPSQFLRLKLRGILELKVEHVELKIEDRINFKPAVGFGRGTKYKEAQAR